MKEYVMVRVPKDVHTKLWRELARLIDHRDFQPMMSRFKHTFSLGDVIEYLVEQQEEHRRRAKKAKAKKRRKASQ